jgi:hypothetical protein
MFRKCKVFIILTIMLVSLVSCTDNGESPSAAGELTALPERVPLSEMAVIEPPESGWTLETINSVLYLDGRKISLPLRFGDLGADFTIPQIEADGKTERFGGTVWYKEKPAFSITGQYTDAEKTLENSLIDTIIVISELNYTDLSDETLLVINGIGIGSPADDIKKNLGTVSFIEEFSTENEYIYAVGESENALLFGVDPETRTVDEIWLVLSFEVNAVSE